MHVFRPKRTKQLVLDENEDENNQKVENSDQIVDEKVKNTPKNEENNRPNDTSQVNQTLNQLKTYDSTPLPSTRSVRRITAPKRTKELALKLNESGIEVTEEKYERRIFRVLEEDSKKLITHAEAESSTFDNFPPLPRYKQRNTMVKLKLRGREVLGLLNDKETEKQVVPGIFRNIKSPDMKASIDVSRLSDALSSSETSSKCSASINLNLHGSITRKESKSTSIRKLQDVLREEKKEISPFELDVLDQNYEIQSILGTGGTGTVFVGTANGEEFAIKVTEINGDEDRVASFYREASLMRKLTNNKHVIQIVFE